MEDLRRDLQARAGDVRALVGRYTPQVRQGFRKVLTGKIQAEPIEVDGRRGYRFSGALTIEKLISGEALALAGKWWPQRGVIELA